VLHLSEHAAYLRIEAARAARAFPMVLERLAEGALNLTGISLLAPHLTPQNCVAILDEARHQSKRDIEQLVARLRPRPDVPAIVRKVAAPKPSPTTAGRSVELQPATPTPCQSPIPMGPARPAEVRPLAPERYKIQFTVDRKTHDKLRRAQDLLRHSIPNGDPAAIFDKALTLLLKKLSKIKHGATDRPRPAAAIAQPSRHIPATVKRAVWQRDGGRCAFVGRQDRCTETGFLEFHHVVPFAAGGETSVENLELRCRAHNVYEADQYFGLGQRLFVRGARDAYVAESSTRSGPSSG